MSATSATLLRRGCPVRIISAQPGQEARFLNIIAHPRRPWVIVPLRLYLICTFLSLPLYLRPVVADIARPARVAWVQHLEHGLRFIERTEGCMRAMVSSIYRRPLLMERLVQYVGHQRTELVGDIALLSHGLHCSGSALGLYATSLLSRLDAHLQFRPGTRNFSLLAAQVQQLRDIGDVGQAVLMQQMPLRSSAEKHDSTSHFMFESNLKRYVDLRVDLRQRIRRIRGDNAVFAPTYNVTIQSPRASRYLPLVVRYFTLPEEPGLLGRNSLHVAAGVNCSEIIAPLLNRGVDINAADDFGLTPLHVGCIHGSVEAGGVLLERGARTELQDKEKRTALHYAAVTRYMPWRIIKQRWKKC